MKTQELTNNELVKLCARQSLNQRAWTEFCARFGDWIWIAVSRTLKEKGQEHTPEFHKDVEDLKSTVYCKLIERDCQALKNFKGKRDNSIYAFLGKIARNEVINFLKKKDAGKRRGKEKSLEDVATYSESNGSFRVKDTLPTVWIEPDTELELQEFKEAILHLLQLRLPQRDKDRNIQIFKLHIFKGLTPEQIAAIPSYDISEKRIRNIISQIRQFLRKELLEKKMEVF